MKKIEWKRLILSVVVPLAVGGLSAWLTRGGMEEFQSMNQPPLSPPPFVFAIVWPILYILMGISYYMIRSVKRNTFAETFIYGLQLTLNFFWSIIFFNMKAYLFAFIWLLLLWLAVWWMIVSFYKVKPLAGKLQIPYILWLTFAAYLNFSVYLLN